MNKLKSKTILSIILLLFFSIVVFVWIFYVKPNFYFKMFPVIPAFFCVVILLSSYFLKKMIENGQNNKSIMHYLAFRLVVLAISALLLFLYFKFDNTNKNPAMLIFVIHYILYLIFQSWMSIGIKKKQQ